MRKDEKFLTRCEAGEKRVYNDREVRNLEHIYSVPLTNLVEEFHLIQLHKAEDFERIAITVMM